MTDTEDILPATQVNISQHRLRAGTVAHVIGPWGISYGEKKGGQGTKR